MKLKERAEQFSYRPVKTTPPESNPTRIMKKIKIIWLVLLAAAVLICWQTSVSPYATTAKIKVENNGIIIVSGRSLPPVRNARLAAGFRDPEATAATAMPYDPYYIHVNDTPHIRLSDAELFALASQPDNSPNRHPNR